jgi:hypothetical protein
MVHSETFSIVLRLHLAEQTKAAERWAPWPRRRRWRPWALAALGASLDKHVMDRIIVIVRDHGKVIKAEFSGTGEILTGSRESVDGALAVLAPPAAPAAEESTPAVAAPPAEGASSTGTEATAED